MKNYKIGMDKKFREAILKIDAANAKDPNKEFSEGKEYPKELLYAQRMSYYMSKFFSDATAELQIAARAQHICRWKIGRDEYPKTRTGYLKWRNELKKMHAQFTAQILKEVGYEKDFIERVTFLIQKKKIKKDSDSQTLEDVICLVFLQYYLSDFAVKHTDEKMVDIIQKTWKKMSEKGHQIALKLPLDTKSTTLVQRALA